MTDPVPDHILNFGEEKTAEEQVESQKDLLPKPTGYRVLILPRGRTPVTEGGIHLAKETVERDSLASVVGYVVAVGPDAYKDTNKFPEGPWCKEGDWILFGRYAGARFKIEGGEMRLLNDDEILALLPDPEAVDY